MLIHAGPEYLCSRISFGFLNAAVTYIQFLKYILSPYKWNDKPVVLEKDTICDMNVIPDIPERL